MTKLNKEISTREILTQGIQRNCIKMELQNIVFPQWSDLGLVGLIFRQCVNTKEQPQGHIYDDIAFRTVLRIIGGKVLISGRPDCYCWSLNKIQSAKSIKLIGTNSAEGLINLCSVLNTVSDDEDKKILADMFAKMKQDLILATTPAEKRRCIEVTPDLYASGITACVDEWMETDENGEAEATPLLVGDFLIVSAHGVYRVGRKEFMETHRLLQC